MLAIIKISLVNNFENISFTYKSGREYRREKIDI